MKQESVFDYTSVCCGVRAEKPACVKPKAVKAKGKKKAEMTEFATLGCSAWRCSGCGKRCKCNRTRRSQ